MQNTPLVNDKDIPQHAIDRVGAYFKKAVVCEIELKHPVGSTWKTIKIPLTDEDLELYHIILRVCDTDLYAVICRAELVHQ